MYKFLPVMKFCIRELMDMLSWVGMEYNGPTFLDSFLCWGGEAWNSTFIYFYSQFKNKSRVSLVSSGDNHCLYKKQEMNLSQTNGHYKTLSNMIKPVEV